MTVIEEELKAAPIIVMLFDEEITLQPDRRELCWFSDGKPAGGDDEWKGESKYGRLWVSRHLDRETQEPMDAWDAMWNMDDGGSGHDIGWLTTETGFNGLGSSPQDAVDMMIRKAGMYFWWVKHVEKTCPSLFEFMLSNREKRSDKVSE